MAEGCFPVSSDNFYMVGSNPDCVNGFGWLKNGECGCRPGSPGWKPEMGGCSVRCAGTGPTKCGMWCGLSDNAKYAVYGVGAVALLGLFFWRTSPRPAPMQGLAMLTAPKRKKRKSRSKRK